VPRELEKKASGPAWLNIKNQVRQGHLAAFFHGKPDTGTTKFWEFHSWPDHDRIEYTVHRDVVQFYLGRVGWEVTYRGKALLWWWDALGTDRIPVEQRKPNLPPMVHSGAYGGRTIDFRRFASPIHGRIGLQTLQRRQASNPPSSRLFSSRTA